MSLYFLLLPFAIICLLFINIPLLCIQIPDVGSLRKKWENNSDCWSAGNSAYEHKTCIRGEESVVLLCRHYGKNIIISCKGMLETVGM